MPINVIPPNFKEKFGKTFVASEYGQVKLIKALEAITDVIDVSPMLKYSVLWYRGTSDKGTPNKGHNREKISE